MNNFKEVVQGFSKVAVPVDELTQGNPLFTTSEWEPTNAGFTHKYEELKNVTAAESVAIGAAYPTVGADFNLQSRDIAFFAGRREVATAVVDAVAGSLDAYMAKQVTPIFNKSLNNVSFDFYYGVARPFAKAKGKLVSAGGTANGKLCSLYFMRWQKGNFSGLVNSKWATDKGGVFKASALSNGGRYVSSAGVSVYGVDYEMPLGFLPANSQNIAGVVNIDLGAITNDKLGKLVTEAMVEARVGAAGNTVCYAPAQLVARISQLNEAQNLGTADNGLFSVMFAGVQIVADWNLLTTENVYSV